MFARSRTHADSLKRRRENFSKVDYTSSKYWISRITIPGDSNSRGNPQESLPGRAAAAFLPTTHR